MPKKPKTVGEEIVSLHGHITGLKKDISNLKNNHLKHLSCSIYKIEKKVDWIQKAMLTGMGALALTLIAILFKLK